MVVRRAPLIQYAERSGTKRSAGDPHGAGSAITASDGARSLAPGLGPSHGAGGRGREGTQCEGLAAKSRASLEKCFEGRIRLLRGGLAILL